MVSSAMPAAEVNALSAALIKVIRMPEIRARLVELGAEVMTMTPGETSQFVVKDRERWSSVIQRAGKDIEGTL
jgi:tripartite-type tricarboxylate transporter receptor subunit TctC